jgi:hypothetical protein
MGDTNSEPAVKQSACVRCSAPTESSDRYCRNCGMEVASEDAKTEAYLAEILPTRVDALLEKRFKDQKLIEVETTELISERAIKWLKIFGFFLGIPIALTISVLTFLGVKTLRNIEDAAVRVTALESALSGPEAQLPEIKRRVGDLNSRISGLESMTDQTQSAARTSLLQLQTNVQDQISSLHPPAPNRSVWRLIREGGDCPGRDVGSSNGAVPEPTRCTNTSPTAVCWDGGLFVNGSRNGAWCTYKGISADQCIGGTSPGKLYRCVSG